MAVAPGDARLYANLALSLDLQGRTAEAASVRAEMASRLAAGQAASAALVAAEPPEPQQPQPVHAEVEQPRPAPVLDTAPAVEQAAAIAVASPQIAVAAPVLVTPDPVRVAEQQPRPTPAPSPAPTPLPRPAPAVSMALATVAPPAEPVRDASSGPRLQRVSMGEVALVTAGPVRWQARSAERPQATALARTTFRPAPVIRLTLLNAARTQGLAARTRLLLQRQGFAASRIAIGNAARVQRSSVVLYPAGRRADAARVAAQLGFALRHRPAADNRLIVLLGRDAVRTPPRRRG